MTRHARLTVLELGAPAKTWASCHELGADDWLVIAQQSDEDASDFSERVLQRARRLCREGAQLDSVDVFTGSARLSAAARRDSIEELAGRLVEGGRLTLWSGGNDARAQAELTELLRQLSPLLAKRELAIEAQASELEASERDERSGVRHAVPTRPSQSDSESELEQSA
ncbi:MAG TPA: hypothetical protein VFK05_23695 [Polyangiaceae bacterium]|nr:hypothetical protein [Polyangiaceae bacterium]